MIEIRDVPAPSRRGPLAVFPSEATDQDGDSQHLIVAYADGSHVTEQDAAYLRYLLAKDREEWE